MFKTIFNDLMLLSVFWMVGFLVREIVKPLQKLLIPASVIGGTIALILGPQVLNFVTIPDSFSEMPSQMINFVLAAMIFGTALNKEKVKGYLSYTDAIVMTYGLQLALGVFLGIVFRKVWTSLPQGWGIMGLFAFWGGHGTVAAAGSLFEELGIPDNQGLGMILATIGLITSIVCGMVLINKGVRKGYAKVVAKNSSDPSFYGGVIPKEKQPSIGNETVSANGLNSVALQLGFIFLSLFVGNSLINGLKLIWAPIGKLPSLLYGIIGAAILWKIMRVLHIDGYADKKTISNLSGVALEITITAAIATLRLDLITTYAVPIAIYSAIIVLLMMWIVPFFCHRWFKVDWFEKMLICFGQSLGSMPSGFALARCVDPDGETTAFDAAGIGTGIFGPIYGSLPAILPLLSISHENMLILIGLLMFIGSVLIGELYFRKH